MMVGKVGDQETKIKVKPIGITIVGKALKNKNKKKQSPV